MLTDFRFLPDGPNHDASRGRQVQFLRSIAGAIVLLLAAGSQTQAGFLTHITGGARFQNPVTLQIGGSGFSHTSTTLTS